MSRDRSKIDKFLADYAQAVLAGDVDQTAASYHSTYIEAAPSSVEAWTVDQNYKQALTAQSSAIRNDLGLTSLDIELLALQTVGPRHFLAEAQWTMEFDSGGTTKSSRFLISYLIRLVDEQPVILAYVSHEDQDAVMQRDGIISAS